MAFIDNLFMESDATKKKTLMEFDVTERKADMLCSRLLSKGYTPDVSERLDGMFTVRAAIAEKDMAEITELVFGSEDTVKIVDSVSGSGGKAQVKEPRAVFDGTWTFHGDLSKDSAMRMAQDMHDMLTGLDDYVDNAIILNVTGDKVTLTVFEDAAVRVDISDVGAACGLPKISKTVEDA